MISIKKVLDRDKMSTIWNKAGIDKKNMFIVCYATLVMFLVQSPERCPRGVEVKKVLL
jgi:hypothetical protein